MEITDTAADVLRQLIERSQQPIILEHAEPRVLVPNGCTLATIPGTLLNPVRKVAKRSFTEIESFCAYVNEQKLPETRLYVSSATEFLAVIDHHQPANEQQSKAGWGEHVARLSLTHTQEWRTWTAKNNTRQGQREFSVFIEDNQQDIIRPISADLIDLVRTFRATSNAEFSSEVEDKEGNSALTYVQQLKTKAGQKGDMEIPNDFDILVAPYEGALSQTLRARLRFTVENSKLVLWYELVKLERFLSTCVDQVATAIEHETELMPWYGCP